jgi:integrase
MCLLTGARRSNIIQMRWEQANLNTNIWMIAQTKNGEPHTVPLVEMAIDILKQRILCQLLGVMLPLGKNLDRLMNFKYTRERACFFAKCDAIIFLIIPATPINNAHHGGLFFYEV